MAIPEQGIGLIYMPGLEPLLEIGSELIDVVEIEPESHAYLPTDGHAPFAIHDDFLKHFRELPYQLLLHGVGLQTAGSVPIMDGYRDFFDHLIEVLKPAWVSQHLSFNRVNDAGQTYDTAFLLPPIQSQQSIDLAVDNIRRFSDGLSVPFAFETSVNYLKPQAGELSEGQFWSDIAEAADCGILLDLHNLWCNQRNGRQSVLDAMAELPLERIWEIHLAGGQEMDGYWLDAHSDLVPDELMSLAEEIIPWLPNLKAINFEIMDDYVQARQFSDQMLLDQMSDIRELWNLRGGGATPEFRQPESSRAEPQQAATELPTPAEWEQILGAACTGDEAGVARFVNTLGEDVGIGIFRQLIHSVRAGIAGIGLRYSCRYLVLKYGKPVVEQLMQVFWTRQKPELQPLAECSAFAAFLTAHIHSTMLSQLLAYDLALLRVKADQDRVTLDFAHDPTRMLAMLDEGQLPTGLGRGHFRLTLGAAA